MNESNESPVTLFRTHRHPVDDAESTPLEVWVAEPVAGAMPLLEPPYPVLWVLDANLFFGTAVETTRLMTQLFAELPPLIVAGLAYPEVDARLQAELRGRDFTPTVDAGFAAPDRAIPGAEPTLPEGQRFGGSAAFAERLLGPARRLVHQRYDAAPGQDIVFGSSLGGLFVVDLFQRRPDAFAAWLAVSPALWWDHALPLRRAHERPLEAPHRTASLFLAVGRGEEGEHLPFLAPFRMVSNVEAMVETLTARGEPDLRVGHAVIEGESHTSVVQPGLTRGLRWALRGAGSTEPG